jgi:hypothetical protein
MCRVAFSRLSLLHQSGSANLYGPRAVHRHTARPTAQRGRGRSAGPHSSCRIHRLSRAEPWLAVGASCLASPRALSRVVELMAVAKVCHLGIANPGLIEASYRNFPFSTITRVLARRRLNMSITSKLLATAVVAGASVLGFNSFAADSVAKSCCCGDNCTCEECDCDGETCENCTCENCSCENCECGDSCNRD